MENEPRAVSTLPLKSFGCILIMTMASVALASSDLALVSAPTGPARGWSLGLPVGPFSQVHMQTGRVWTAIPIVGWSGRGPAVSFTLYHHMISPFGRPNPGPGFESLAMGDANFDGAVNEDDIAPFTEIMMAADPTEQELAVTDFDDNAEVDSADIENFSSNMVVQQAGPLWTHNYDTCLYIQTNTITVIWGDGIKDVYTWESQSQSWKPPAGVFNALAAEAPPDNGYMLTTKAQDRVHFLANGKLDYIQDPSGNQVTCTYIDDPLDAADGKLDFVQDAPGRTLDLTYNAGGRLSQIIAPLDVSTTRTWTLLYEVAGNPTGEPTIDGTGPLKAIDDPMTHRIAVTYNAGHDLATISDKNGNTWAFAYASNGRLESVTDPLALVEQFVQYSVIGGLVEGRYIDVRGKLWKTRHAGGTGNLVGMTNPLNQTASLYYDDPRPQLAHEATSAQNALGKSWHFTYDGAANVLTTADPLGNVTTYTYDPLNNLLTVTPPGAVPGSGNPDKMVELYYEDSVVPTSVTRVVEPADGQGNGPAETTLEYYHEVAGSYPLKAYGKLHKVTPPYSFAPVVVEAMDLWGGVGYDPYGNPAGWLEGPPSDGGEGLLGGSITAVRSWSAYQVNGWPVQSCAAGITSSSNSAGSYDANGNLLEMFCNGCKPSWTCSCFNNDNGYAPYFPSESNPVLPLPGWQDSPGGGFAGSAGNPWWLSDHTNDYNSNGQLTHLPRHAAGIPYSTMTTRTFDITYDDLGRPLSRTITSNEPTVDPSNGVGPEFTRTTTYDYDDVGGTFTEYGPDGQQTHVVFDDAYRPVSITRGSITATATYYADGAVDTVTYGNGTRTKYIYDDATRPTTIRHETTAGVRIHELNYDWSADGLVAAITDTDDAASVSLVTFVYDNRDRLIEEERTGQHTYHLRYMYDLAGNRLSKQDLPNELSTLYTYDVQDPLYYGSQGNRLVESRTIDDASGELLHERFYLYDRGGRANYVIVKDDPEAPGPDGPIYTGTQILYNSQGLAAVAWKVRWRLLADGSAVNDATVEYLSAMQYRYDSGRSRYLVQRSDPRLEFPSGDTNSHFRYPWTPELGPGTEQWSASEGKWSDYAGGEVRGDFELTVSGTDPNQTANKHNTMAHESGLAQTPWVAGAPSSADTSYLHGNLVGSTERMSDADGEVVRRVVYTAFGEPVFEDGTVGTRYGYAGAWGYQGSPYDSGDPLADLGWLHVGARYYDPASGRFVQRDPIGMAGGPNTYVYAGNNPVSNIDPLGLDWRNDFVGGLWESITFGFGDAGANVNRCSGGYLAGQVTGIVATSVAISYLSAPLRVVGAARAASRYRALVRQAMRQYPKLAGTKHWHHITPRYLGGLANGPTVELNAAYHQYITNAFRHEWAYRQELLPSPTQLQRIMSSVYSRFPLE